MYNRRAFHVSVGLSALAAGVRFTPGLAADVEPSAEVGPMVGHVSASSAVVWYRPTSPGKYALHVRAQSEPGKAGRVQGKEFEASAVSEAFENNDLCITWRIGDLDPSTRYQYSIHREPGTLSEAPPSTSDSQPIVGGEDCYFETAPADQRPSKVCLAFGSCAPIKPLALWTQMAEQGSQGIVLLGDTPYIDSRNLATARAKHREFLSIPELSQVIRHTPVWGTWDDHDFGANDSDGNLPGKENTRRAFAEYRANDSCGEDDEGIYTKFRYGPIEVFLLDTRWFSRTEPSPVDPNKPTLLGKRQWDWLLKSLEESTANFKLITCGMIWDDKENSESDDWGTYTHERSALFDFLGEEKISGVVLIGGDIHCSRLLRYKTEKQVGYPLHQLIVSPIHDRIIPSLNVAHPDLIKGAAIPHVWLRLEVDSTQSPATLHAEWVQMNGQEMWDLSLNEDQLKQT